MAKQMEERNIFPAEMRAYQLFQRAGMVDANMDAYQAAIRCSDMLVEMATAVIESRKALSETPSKERESS